MNATACENCVRCCWPTASRPALSADLAFRRYSASASPHFDDFVCFFERGVPPSWQRLWKHSRCVNRRGAERAFCDRRKRDLRQFDLRHVAPRQWFFRRCSLACSGRASARVCARLGGCRGQLCSVLSFLFSKRKIKGNQLHQLTTGVRLSCANP